MERERGKKTYNKYLISAILTLGLILILVFSGTVEAVRIYISSERTSYATADRLVSFIAEVDIETLEKVPLQNLTINIRGPSNETCVFSPGGTKLIGCANISTISVANSFGFGYGYGFYYNSSNGQYYGYGYDNVNGQSYFFGYEQFYGYGYASGYTYGGALGSELKYNITWNLTKASAEYGSYNATLDALVSGGGTTHTYTSSSPARFNYTCTESWSYGSWSDCTNGRQTRAAADANSCGTTNDRGLLSRTCSGAGGSGGGGASGVFVAKPKESSEEQLQEGEQLPSNAKTTVIPAGEVKLQKETPPAEAPAVEEEKVPLKGSIFLLLFAILIAILLPIISYRKSFFADSDAIEKLEKSGKLKDFGKLYVTPATYRSLSKHRNIAPAEVSEKETLLANKISSEHKVDKELALLVVIANRKLNPVIITSATKPKQEFKRIRFKAP